MNSRTIFLVLASGALLAAPAPAAQRWGNGPTPGAGACFYEYPNFRGRYFCARVGEDLAFIPNDMTDRIESIRVFGGGQLIAYSYDRFDGAQAWFDYDVADLRNQGWDDRISSVRVGMRPPRGRRWDQRLFEGNLRGYEGSPRGQYRSEAPGAGRDFRAPQRGNSAADVEAIVRRAYQDLLHREPDATGLQGYRDRMLRDGWSEAQVRQALTDSAEYRNRSANPRQQAQDIVRAAYLAVLKREPDAGSAGWVDRVLNDHWTQQDVERGLRDSPEYKARNSGR